ncbi:MAG: hypothetical protein ACPH9N_06050 [Alteromonas sp.]
MKRSVCFLAGISCLVASPFLQAAGDAKHYPGVFIGATHADSETDYALGIEYEYKFTKQFGVGAVWERTPDGHGGDGVNVALGSIFYHPTPEWRLGLGLGEERIGGPKVKYKDLVRASIAYEMPMDEIIIAPTLAVDFVDGDKIIVAGVAILMPF